MIQLYKDFRQSEEILHLLFKIPTAPGHWVVFEQVDHLLHHYEGDKVISRAEMSYQVDGMTMKWKVFSFVLIVIPRMIIWVLLMFYGSIWLMNESDRVELILNAVALVFILDIDEVLYSAITHALQRIHLGCSTDV